LPGVFDLHGVIEVSKQPRALSLKTLLQEEFAATRAILRDALLACALIVQLDCFLHIIVGIPEEPFQLFCAQVWA